MEIVMPGIGVIFWMTFTFVLLLVLLRKFAWIPILTTLKSREEKIADSLALAKQTQEEMKQLKAQNETMMKEARQEREQMIKEATEARKQMIAEAKADAQAEADKVLAAARASIQSEKQAAMGELKAQLADFSIQIAEKILTEELGDKAKQQALVNKQIETINFN
jgi:F-type H+-transporting ATPase subunit b